MEYYENGGLAVAKLLWSYPGRTQQIVPQANLSSNAFAFSNNKFDARETIVKQRFGNFDYRMVFKSAASGTNDADDKSIDFISSMFTPVKAGAKFTDSFVLINTWEHALRTNWE